MRVFLTFALTFFLSAALATANPATREVPLDHMAFTHHAAALTFDQRIHFEKGRVIFQRLWLPAPTFGMQRRLDGLGPLYNASACARCHIRNGRGSAPDSKFGLRNLVMRVAVPGENGEAAGSDPVYGRQIQMSAIPGHVAEAAVSVTYSEHSVKLADGTAVPLRRPTYTMQDLAYGPLHNDAVLSPRVAPPMIGLGLLETIAASDILANADPDDSDGNGISGRAAVVPNEDSGAVTLGRFGWRAEQPTVFDQTVAAFADHIGMSSFVRPEVFGDCQPAQVACREAPDGADPHEIETYSFHMVVHYSQQVAVPARESTDDRVFVEAGCADCHRQSFKVPGADGAPAQIIRPYTDLLLHDMGDGLADGAGREWRTAPLWGLGLTKTVNADAGFLHDGRARTILEAILWHGGEAAAARQRVIQMTADDRKALLDFLSSL